MEGSSTTHRESTPARQRQRQHFSHFNREAHSQRMSLGSCQPEEIRRRRICHAWKKRPREPKTLLEFESHINGGAGSPARCRRERNRTPRNANNIPLPATRRSRRAQREPGRGFTRTTGPDALVEPWTRTPTQTRGNHADLMIRDKWYRPRSRHPRAHQRGTQERHLDPRSRTAGHLTTFIRCAPCDTDRPRQSPAPKTGKKATTVITAAIASNATQRPLPGNSNEEHLP